MSRAKRRNVRFTTTPDDGPGNPTSRGPCGSPATGSSRSPTAFQLPVGIAFVPNPGRRSDSPLFYVVEMHRGIKVVLRDGSVRTYAKNLLNFDPLDYQSSAQQGVTGITVDPVSGDVFASMLYQHEHRRSSRSLGTRRSFACTAPTEGGRPPRSGRSSTCTAPRRSTPTSSAASASARIESSTFTTATALPRERPRICTRISARCSAAELDGSPVTDQPLLRRRRRHHRP